jgi:glutathione peroxidase
MSILMVPLNTTHAADNKAACPETLDFTKRTLAGNESVNLCKKYLGKVVVVVNTASKCGYTYQYEGLEALYSKYKDQGLVVLGFPSNDFGGQEPGNEKQIQDFCRLTYGVEFPMFEKTNASRYTADPLYQTLAKLSGQYPQWNFHKYVLDRKGNLVASFNSRVEPQGSQMINTIEELL